MSTTTPTPASDYRRCADAKSHEKLIYKMAAMAAVKLRDGSAVEDLLGLACEVFYHLAKWYNPDTANVSTVMCRYGVQYIVRWHRQESGHFAFRVEHRGSNRTRLTRMMSPADPQSFLMSVAPARVEEEEHADAADVLGDGVTLREFEMLRLGAAGVPQNLIGRICGGVTKQRVRQMQLRARNRIRKVHTSCA